MQTGITSGSYLGSAAPSGFPTAARNGNGDISVTFLSSYGDDFNVSGSFSISSLLPGLVSSTAGTATAERVSGTVVRLRAFSSAGTAISDARITLSVW